MENIISLLVVFSVIYFPMALLFFFVFVIGQYVDDKRDYLVAAVLTLLWGPLLLKAIFTAISRKIKTTPIRFNGETTKYVAKNVKDFWKMFEDDVK